MGTKEEIQEMFDSLERGVDGNQTDAPFTDAPAQTPDETPKTEAPSTTPPKEEGEEDGPKTSPPATKAPTVDEEKESLKRRIAELEATAPKKEDKQTPPATDAPIPEQDFLKGVDLEELRDNPTELNKVLNKLFTQAITVARGEIGKVKTEAFEVLPTKVEERIQATQQLKSMTDQFYKDNPDLKKFPKVVGTIFDELVQKTPGAKVQEILGKVGDETRSRLGLEKPKAAPKPKDKSNSDDPPPLPRRSGGRVPSPKPEPKGTISSQIAEMNRTLGR